MLVVSYSPSVLPFASIFLRSLRGDDLVVEARLLSATREWRRLVRAADLVLADALCVEALRKAGARRLREVRVISESALERLREALTIIAPVVEAKAPRPARLNAPAAENVRLVYEMASAGSRSPPMAQAAPFA